MIDWTGTYIITYIIFGMKKGLTLVARQKVWKLPKGGGGGGWGNTLNPPPGSASELGHRLLTAFLALLTTGRTRKKKHGLPNTRTHSLDLISRRNRAKNDKEMYKKVWYTCKVVLPSKPLFVCLFLKFSLPCSADLTVPNNYSRPMYFWSRSRVPDILRRHRFFIP